MPITMRLRVSITLAKTWRPRLRVRLSAEVCQTCITMSITIRVSMTITMIRTFTLRLALTVSVTIRPSVSL